MAVTPSAVRIGDQTIPIDRQGRMWLHFGRFPADKIVSAAEVLGKAKRLRPESFAGKTVVIGLSAEGTSDIAATPLAAEEYGPLIQAQAVDSMLRGGWLRRPAWAGPAEWAAAALLALLALGNALFGRRYRIALGAAFVAVPIVSWLAFANGGLLLDPARPMLVGGGAMAGVALGLFAMARADRERLREALVQERITAAETDGELQAARAIQLGMVPPRDRGCRSSTRASTSMPCWSRPKSVGGDYYRRHENRRRPPRIRDRRCHRQGRPGSLVHGHVEGADQCCFVAHAGRSRAPWRKRSTTSCSRTIARR